jgi:hypothetical protein
MSILDLRKEVDAAVRAFAWDQWAQLGVLAEASAPSPWVVDPEALVLLSLEVGRDDPRLFGEVLDWLLANERLISVQRLRNLAVDPEDKALGAAALAWVARSRPRARLSSAPGDRETKAQPLFRTTVAHVRRRDEVFLRYGFIAGAIEPSGNSRPPDALAPINLAVRLRLLLGVGARAEVVRTLLTTDAPRIQPAVIARSAGYAKRNVQEALTALQAAGVVFSAEVGNEQRYATSFEHWAALLELDQRPVHRDWPQLLLGLRRIIRWLHDPRTELLSDYMLASEARELMARAGPLLRYAGVHVDEGGRGAEYWPRFEQSVRAALAQLGPPRDLGGRPT